MIRITSSGLIRISALGVLQWRQRRQSQLPKQVCVAPVSRQAPKRRMYTSQSQLTRTLVHRLVKICKRLLQFPESDVHNPKECRLHIFVFADLLELAQYSARFCMLPSHSGCIADKMCSPPDSFQSSSPPFAEPRCPRNTCPANCTPTPGKNACDGKNRLSLTFAADALRMLLPGRH